MTHIKKIIKEAKQNGNKVDREVVKGLKAFNELHELTKKCKHSPSKIHEKIHSGNK